MSKLGKIKINHRKLYDFVTYVGLFVGMMALFALLVYQLAPVKLADIKVPVATDKASYYAGQPIKGIFFGEIYYNGEVRILREVFCADNYHRTIKPPAESAVDGDFFATQSKPHKLDGDTIPIGTLPDDAPLGANCVLQFTNVYDIKTPFGTRHEEYQYYTQNFSIVTKEKREELDSGTKPQATSIIINGDASSFDGGSSSDGKTEINNSTTNNTTNNTTTTTPPVTVHQECRINFIVKLGCKQVAD